MNDQIYQDLKSLHLSGMAQSWMLLHETRKLGELTLQDGMAVLIQTEHDQRTNNRTARLLSQARFRYNASIEELAFNTAQGRDKNQILSLATCEYIKQGASVLVLHLPLHHAVFVTPFRALRAAITSSCFLCDERFSAPLTNSFYFHIFVLFSAILHEF